MKAKGFCVKVNHLSNTKWWCFYVRRMKFSGMIDGAAWGNFSRSHAHAIRCARAAIKLLGGKVR